MTEGQGLPIGLSVDGANRHDRKLTERPLPAVVIPRPEPTPEQPQPLSWDKGDDYAAVRETVTAYGYTAPIRTRGEEAPAKQELPGYRARRGVVERPHSWLNRFRRLLIRWEKPVANYIALLHFACAWIAFRAAGIIQDKPPRPAPGVG